MLKLGSELFERQSGLLNNAPQGAGFERLVLGNNNRALCLSHDEMRTGLANEFKSQPF